MKISRFNSYRTSLYSHWPALMMGLAGSQGPITTFLYRCSPINHQLQPPIAIAVPSPQRMIPTKAAFQVVAVGARVTPNPAPAPSTSEKVSDRWPCQEI